MTSAGRLRIGLTGPIGCGKSTVASWLGELGAAVIDADQVAREVTPPGSEVLAAVVEAFGTGVLRDDGTLDRAGLGRIVFADPAALGRLEAIIHPAVRPRILAAMEAAEASGAPAVVVEAIKLVEGGLAALCDDVWLVTCEPEVQHARVAARASADLRAAGQLAASTVTGPAAQLAADPGAETEARVGHPATDEPGAGADREARIAAQAGMVAAVTPYATRVIDTSGSMAESRSRVVAAWNAAVEGSGPALSPDA